ncbi:MAG: nicotinate phosphoribosyltransferase [Planctomycetaceae bacterium]|nr:nicotinate phosphoribosyltransferase [Planctomycetaceae bacterium]
MSQLSDIYRTSFSLLTDLYQLTMAYGYWKQAMAERDAVFHLTFRTHPFDGQFAIACGLRHAVSLLKELRFSEDDLAYLSSLQGADDQPLFGEEFLEYLRQIRFSCDVDAMPEGTAVFAHEPLVRVSGPLLQAQLLETALLNIINFQTLIATKAARVCQAAQGDPVLEFGLRRAQGIDGGLTASRAAYIGGAAATSNVLAGKLFDIPVKGTHAHSWLMSFDTEREAFNAYAAALPNNCVFLVDTYDTIEGVRNAAVVGKELGKQGHEMLGVRLDSGDLAELSNQARVVLDEAGFHDAAIVGSNDLDEHSIACLKRQGAKVSVWGVGTKLVTGYDQPALGGVYKLSALRDDAGWKPKIKLSEDRIKVSTPGKLQVRRFVANDGQCLGDIMFDELSAMDGPATGVPLTESEVWSPASHEYEDLLVPVFRGGEQVYQLPSIHDSRARTSKQLQMLDPSITRLDDPRPYRVALEPSLHETKERLIEAAQRKDA